MAVVEEDAAAGVAALDGAIGIVPFIDPADGHGGALADVGFAHVDALREVAQKRECSVKHGAITAADNVDFADQIAVPCGDEELVGLEGRHSGFGSLRAHLLHGAEKDHVGAALEGRAAGKGKQSAAKFDRCGLFEEALLREC